MSDYLPTEVLFSPKEGFGAPIKTWVNSYKSKYFDRVLIDGYLIRNKLINANRLRSMVNRVQMPAKEAWQYWKILILEIWFQIFIEKRDYNSVF